MLELIIKISLISLLCLCSVLEAGKSTRYWDCCKASCGWSRKADLRNDSHPVNSCAKDGKTVLADVNAKSTCESDSPNVTVSKLAFMCSKNQPWAVNTSFAYGFAAAKLKGKEETQWCCACYEMTFSTAPVTGQKMVVQVTNTGGDLTDDHFDIAIPGGGVGIFDWGCTIQWGAPKEGWGVRYGGVSTDADCKLLPADLQPGCHWRFGWFKGADNPSFDFKRVKCPAVLTDITGCIRADEPA